METHNYVSLDICFTMFYTLQKVTSENDLEFDYKDYGGDLGALVESVNDFSSDVKGNRFWHYWVNNIYADISASNYILESGDIIEWKYTLNQFNLIVN